MSPAKGKPGKRNRSKSIHTSVPTALESDEKPKASSDDELEVPQLDQTNGSDAEDSETDGWSSNDEQELVKNIRQFTNKSDKLKYMTRVQRLDWSKIAFKKYSPKECQERFTKYLKMVRNYRTLHEVLSDVEEEIKKIPFKKPLNSYQLFVQDQLSKASSSGDFSKKMQNMAVLYKNLSPEEHEKYDKKAREALLEYNQKKMVYLSEKNPDSVKTPFFLFSEHWKLKDNKLTATQLKQKYGELSQKEKFEWVKNAVKRNPGISVTSFLTKDEQRLYRGLPKSVGTSFSIFVKEMYAEFKESHHEKGKKPFTEIAEKWRTLSSEEKEKYEKACAELKQKAIKETQAINEKFGVKVTKAKRAAVKTKKHKSSETIPSDDEDQPEENHKAPPSPPTSPKKRKTESSEEPKEAKRAKADKTIVKVEEFASPAPITSTPHVKAKKRNNTVTSEDTADEDKSEPKRYMVEIPFSQCTDEQSDASFEKKKKKKKKNSLPEKKLSSIQESEAEASTSSSVSSSKKKEKKDRSPEKTVNRTVQDSEAEASTSSSMSESKKKKKKDKTLDAIQAPGKRPPSNVLDYYASHVYTGKPHKVQKSFDKLSKKEKKELTAQHNEIVEKYVSQLRSYLESMTKEEALIYVARLKSEEEARKSETDGSQVY